MSEGQRVSLDEECRRWDRRYEGEPGLFFGESPTPLLVESLAQAPWLGAGSRALCLGEGEGRDALFLARAGLAVTAVDGSVVGLDKLCARARAEQLELELVHTDLQNYAIAPRSFDLIASFYCHLEPGLRRRVFRAAARGLAPGGVLLIEGFAPGQLEAKLSSGGPRDPRLLFRSADLRADVEGLAEVELSFESVTEIDIGHHRGRAMVTRLRACAPGGPPSS